MSSLATREENFSFSDGAYRESAQALTYIVANTTPETLHQKFLQAGSLLVADQIDTLLPLVQELGLMPHGRLQLALNATDVRHCVRCHQIYMEIDNGLSACLIKHSLPREAPSRSLPPSPDYLLYYHCCRQFVVPGSDFHSRLRDSYHFVGRHTTRREIVFNSTNVQQCFLCSLSNSHNRPPGTTAHGFDDSSVACVRIRGPDV
ncbi:hypothetical protein C8J57DRAFT_708660 [Mycena rebaudengoi]|nr:hypothetical protein C8J57DRAFT_708660 [Mycena rebaudengoi]